jgi:hypothetical protein
MLKTLQVALIRRLARKRLGRDIAPLNTVATHPDFFIAYAKFSQALEKTNLVPTPLKVLGQIRAAKLVECPF